MCAKSLQAYPTPCDPRDCRPPGSSVHGILQARILEWVAMPSSRRSSWPKDRTCISFVSCISRQVLYHWHYLIPWTRWLTQQKFIFSQSWKLRSPRWSFGPVQFLWELFLMNDCLLYTHDLFFKKYLLASRTVRNKFLLCEPPSARSQREELHSWQRSWGRRLDIRKGGIEPQESPWKFSSIYPQNQSLPILLLCALRTYTSDFMGGCPPPPLLEKELT